MGDEDPDDIQQLLSTLRDEHQPVGASEEILVYKIAEHFFYGKRASYLLSEQLDFSDNGENNTRQVALMLRYHTTADRGYYRALNELRKLQKERRLQEIGFVSQNAPNPADAHAEPTETPAKPAPQPAPQPITPAPIPQITKITPFPAGIEVEFAAPKAA
jgi:hypothetical protein